MGRRRLASAVWRLALGCIAMGVGAVRAETAGPTLPVLRQMLETGQAVRIVCFGDSITGAYYHSGGRRAWPELLQLALGQVYPHNRSEVVNAGVSGNTTADALKRLDHDVLRLKPNLVVMMFGMNDVARLTPATFRRNLAELTHRIQAAGAAILLMTPNLVFPDDADRPLPRLLEYAAITREVAAANRVEVVDCTREQQALLSFDRGAWTALMSETIHPNLRGHVWFAEAVAHVLTGRCVTLEPLPTPTPALPRLHEIVRRGGIVRVVAMRPFDAVIGKALHALNSALVVNIAVWDPSGKSLPTLADDAKGFGWWRQHEHPDETPPDLIIVAVPTNALASDLETFRRDYGAVLNNTLSFGASSAMPWWDCLVVSPTVEEPDLTPFQHYVASQVREIARDKDLPFLDRPSGDLSSAEALLTAFLRRGIGGVR